MIPPAEERRSGAVLLGGRFVVQVAGVADLADAMAATAGGATHVGFPLRLAHHGEDCSDEQVRQIVAGLPPAVTAVLITYLERAGEISCLARSIGVYAVQLHGEPPLEEVLRLRRLEPRLALFKSLVVGTAKEAELAAHVERLAPHVDAFVTDSFDPRTGARGATGRTHDWRVSARLVERSPRPVILAGGLTPENVAAAIAAVRPAGVDAHTGVEDAAGRKSLARVREFAAAAREAARREGIVP